MKITLSLIIFISLYPLISFSQITQEWVQRYNGPSSGLDLSSGMILLDDGSAIVYGHSAGTGTQLDMTVIKYSPSGALTWEARYNGLINGNDNLRAAAIDESNNVYAIGYITDSNNVEMSIIKFNENGAFQWITYLDLPGYSDSFGQDITISPSGYIYVCGFAKNQSGNFDYITMRLTPSGDKLWTKTFDGVGHGNDNSVGIACDSKNNVLVTGTSYGLFNSEDIVTVKYNSSGALLLEWTYDGLSSQADRPASITVDHDDHFVIAGVTYSDTSNFDYITLRISPSGSQNWYKLYNGIGNSLDYSYKVVTDAENNIYVTGSSRNGSTLGTEDVLTIKYDTSGNQLWVNRFDSHPGGSDIGYSLTLDNDNNVYIAAAVDRDTNHLIFGTMKIRSNGILEWLRTYEYYHSPEDFPYSIAVDTSKNVYISGISFGGTTDYDITTIKYSQSVNIDPIYGTAPEVFTLYQNYPNPFNPSTKIKFDIPASLENDLVKLSIFNSLGQIISIPFNSTLTSGSYEYTFDASQFASGIYYYNISFSGTSKTRKMLLIK